MDSSGDKVLLDNKPLLEFVAVQRSDNKEWSIPGVRGMCVCCTFCYVPFCKMS